MFRIAVTHWSEYSHVVLPSTLVRRKRTGASERAHFTSSPAFPESRSFAHSCSIIALLQPLRAHHLFTYSFPRSSASHTQQHHAFQLLPLFALQPRPFITARSVSIRFVLFCVLQVPRTLSHALTQLHPALACFCIHFLRPPKRRHLAW